MAVRTRLSLAVALLVTVLLGLTAVAVGGLWSLHLPGLAVLAALAGAGAVLGVLFAYGLARERPEEPDEPEPALVEPAPPRAGPVQVATRTIPSAQLPPEYLAAVMNGVRARHAAFRAEAAHKPDAAVH